MTISYEVGNNLYLNLTNKCPCACTFCIRNSADGAYGSDPLWLEHEPTIEEIMEDLNSRDLDKYTEIVFCGYGEPTCRLDTVIAVADELKARPSCPLLRINTNGLSDLINSKSTAESLCNVMDIISISLNAGTKDEYMKVTRPKYPEAFEAMQKFTSDCVKTKSAQVIMSVVDVIPPEQIQASREIAEKLGAVLRVRAFEE
ncbi:MAG: TIGR04100 family radical SAM protein [Ruminococcus sp.]|nr:TIGR04100 family radical SAM protein [Ruminococcus sp.]